MKDHAHSWYEIGGGLIGRKVWRCQCGAIKREKSKKYNNKAMREKK